MCVGEGATSPSTNVNFVVIVILPQATSENVGKLVS